jgi:hypothetical protein
MRWCLLFATAMSGCVTLTPAGAGVSVYKASLVSEQDRREPPTGCRRLSSSEPRFITELELEGQKDPFRVERNSTGVEGGNALLVQTRMIMGRRDPECTNSLPITDCPSSSGAWFRMVIDRYVCTDEGLQALANAQPKGHEGLHP